MSALWGNHLGMKKMAGTCHVMVSVSFIKVSETYAIWYQRSTRKIQCRTVTRNSPKRKDHWLPQQLVIAGIQKFPLSSRATRSTHQHIYPRLRTGVCGTYVASRAELHAVFSPWVPIIPVLQPGRQAGRPMDIDVTRGWQLVFGCCTARALFSYS